MRYFRFFSRLWKYSRVEGFRTMAERKTRAGRIQSVHHRLCQPNQNDDRMNEEDDELAHSGNGIKASKPPD